MSSENPPTFASFILRGESWEGSGMVYLRQGMSGPLVVALQILLNRKLPSGVEPLEVDGHFGRKTFKAVWAFQRAQGLSVDGVVAQQTWPVLTGQSLVSLNAIDIMDPNLLSQAADVRQAGGNPILTGGACNGLDMVLNEIRARGPRGAVVLLRFGGHGAPGRMNVSKGHGMLPLSDGTEIWVDPDQERAAITSVTLMANYGRFASLAPIFASFGCVMMMGCEVAADPEGMPLLEGLANVWGVPVTAGTRSQYWTFEQVGAVRSAYPRGLDLRSWAKSQREATAGMSCA